MAQIDDYLELTQLLPRDTIKILKLIREIDEKSVSNFNFSNNERFTKIITENRNKSLNIHKQKGKIDADILKQIENDFSNLTNLSEHKIELVNELNYLQEFYLKKLNEIVESCEKNLPNLNLALANQLAMGDIKSLDRSIYYDDNYSVTGSSNRLIIILEKKTDHFSAKSNKDLSAPNLSGALLKKKKNRSIKPKKENEEAEEFSPAVIESNLYEYDKVELEPTYCFCNGVSYGDMIQCDFDGVILFYLIN